MSVHEQVSKIYYQPLTFEEKLTEGGEREIGYVAIQLSTYEEIQLLPTKKIPN